MSLTPAFLDELRARTLLSALVGKTVKLTKAGREFKGCCPFHNEKTPSFYVNDDKAFYHCFGCSAHGDAIRWMTEQRGLPFIDAVKELAQAAGMEMPAQDRQAVERAERAKGLHDVLQAAADWFEAQLGGLDGGEARALLERRKISDATRRAFNFGYAPDSRGKLRTALRDFGDALLIEAGLLIKVEDKEPYDRFRGRLMIPIRDPRGRVIAFGGRIVGDGEPKYLNSPDTPLFDKGRTLYNLDKAAPASRKTNRLIVVEGYMDVIALAQAGFGDVVAPNGTAVTEAQLERMWRMADVPVICLDGDAAGQKAALRAAQRALPLVIPGRSLKFATLPKGQDPDDVVRSSGSAAMEEILNEATDLADFIWRAELSAIPSSPTPDERAALRQRLMDRADAINNPAVRAEYRQEFRDKFSALFHPKHHNFRAIREAVVHAEKQKTKGLEYAFHRAVLLGLMRYPAILSQMMEDVQRLPLAGRYLSVWKTRLLDILFEYDDLSESMIDKILHESDVGPIEARNYSIDLAYSFFRDSSDEATATRDLRQIIELLNDEHENKIALGLSQKAFEQAMTNEMFARHQQIVLDAEAFRTRLADWLQAARDAEFEERFA